MKTETVPVYQRWSREKCSSYYRKESDIYDHYSIRQKFRNNKIAGYE